LSYHIHNVGKARTVPEDDGVADVVLGHACINLNCAIASIKFGILRTNPEEVGDANVVLGNACID
jgi:hypothetical protein